MALSINLQLIYNIIITVTGLLGNTTTIIVFSQRRLRSLRSSFFLTCLAITDLVFILILIVALLNELQVPVMTSPVCMLTIYFSHIASFLSSNFTLAYTSHRLIGVFFPIKATTFLKQRTNRIMALSLFIFACSFYLLSFPVTLTTFRSNQTTLVDCTESEKSALLFPFLILDTIFTFIIPFSLITCMNLAIVYKLQSKATYMLKTPISKTPSPLASPSAKSSTNSSAPSIAETIPLPTINNNVLKSSNISATTTPLSNTSTNSTPTLKRKGVHHLLQRHQNRSLLCVRPLPKNKQPIDPRSRLSSRRIPPYQGTTSICIRSTQRRTTASAKTTKMLLAASTVFLVFNLPYHLLLFCFLFIKSQPQWMSTALNIARYWFFASFCVNFFVYAICGQRFRMEVVRLFSCSALRTYYSSRHQKTMHDHDNSIYLSQRMLPIASTHFSQTN